jgi:hypothetical protein
MISAIAANANNAAMTFLFVCFVGIPARASLADSP